jgi:hypothetical protein
MANSRRPRRPGGRPKGRAEQNYIGIRSLMSNSINMDERFDIMLKTALVKRFGEDKAETLYTMKLTGFLDQMKKGLKYTATREDHKRLFMEAEKMRWDKKRGLTKAEATARLFSGKSPTPIKIRRPSEYEAKPGTIYRPRPGSAEGKIEVNQIGAEKTYKQIEQTFLKLFTMFDGIKGNKGRKLNVGVNISRSVSKHFKGK